MTRLHVSRSQAQWTFFRQLIPEPMHVTAVKDGAFTTLKDLQEADDL